MSAKHHINPGEANAWANGVSGSADVPPSDVVPEFVPVEVVALEDSISIVPASLKHDSTSDISSAVGSLLAIRIKAAIPTLPDRHDIISVEFMA